MPQVIPVEATSANLAGRFGMRDRLLWAKSRRLGWGLALVLSFAILLLPALSNSDTAQEDALITARHARNLVDGRGLVFNPGEKVLGTTTLGWAIATAWIYALPIRPAFQIRVLQLFSTALVVLALAVIASTVQRSIRSGVGCLLALVAMPIIGHTSSAGMETAAVLFVGSLLWRRLMRVENLGLDYVALGYSVLLLVLRLDTVFMVAAVYGAMAVGAVFINQEPFLPSVRRWLVVPLAALSLAAGALLSATWLLYGQPFPQSMLAKAGAGHYGGWRSFVLQLFGNCLVLAGTDFPWPVKIQWLRPAALLASLTFLLWVMAIVRRETSKPVRLLAFASGAYIAGYALFLTAGRAGVFPWYRHGTFFLLASAVVLGSLEDRRRWVKGVFVLWAALWATEYAIISRGQFVHGSPSTSYRLVGEYLEARHAGTVMLEPVGYVGFYARDARILDLGGLTSIEIDRFRRTGEPGWFAKAAKALRPDFVVLRINEIERNVGWNVGILFATPAEKTWWGQSYELDKTVDAGFGDRFAIYRRTTGPPFQHLT